MSVLSDRVAVLSTRAFLECVGALPARSDLDCVSDSGVAMSGDAAPTFASTCRVLAAKATGRKFTPMEDVRGGGDRFEHYGSARLLASGDPRRSSRNLNKHCSKHACSACQDARFFLCGHALHGCRRGAAAGEGRENADQQQRRHPRSRQDWPVRTSAIPGDSEVRLNHPPTGTYKPSARLKAPASQSSGRLLKAGPGLDPQDPSCRTMHGESCESDSRKRRSSSPSLLSRPRALS